MYNLETLLKDYIQLALMRIHFFSQGLAWCRGYKGMGPVLTAVAMTK